MTRIRRQLFLEALDTFIFHVELLTIFILIYSSLCLLRTRRLANMAISLSSIRYEPLLSSEIPSMAQRYDYGTNGVRIVGPPGRSRNSMKARFLLLSSKCEDNFSPRGLRSSFRVCAMPSVPESGDPGVAVLELGVNASIGKGSGVPQSSCTVDTDNGGGGKCSLGSSGGNNGKTPYEGRGGGGGAGPGAGGSDGHGEDDHEEEEFGPVMKYEEVMKEAEARRVSLPSDMLQEAKTVGLRKVLLDRYLDLQGSIWPVGFAMRSCSWLRNRMLADPSFLFKVGTEVAIDSCCATLAEAQNRGKDFGSEFELFIADLCVGIVVDIALVGMLAPYACFGQPTASKGFLGCLQAAIAALPSSVFEAERPGCRFTVQERIAAYFYKGVLYGLVGVARGFIGQGIANLKITAKCSTKKSEEDIHVLTLVESAALSGVFCAVSSSTRNHIMVGFEHLVEASPMAKREPFVAKGITSVLRLANNNYGRNQFKNWASVGSGQRIRKLVASEVSETCQGDIKYTSINIDVPMIHAKLEFSRIVGRK